MPIIRKVLMLALLATFGIPALAADAARVPALPTANPVLPDSPWGVMYGSPAVAGLAVVPGPAERASRRLRPDEIQWRGLGPVNTYVLLTSGVYPDGRRVIWAGGYDRIVKLDQATLRVLATYVINGQQFINDGDFEQRIAQMDAMSDEAFRDASIELEMQPLMVAAATTYRSLDRNNDLYISQRLPDGRMSLRIYGERDPRDPESAIVLRREWTIPQEISKAPPQTVNHTYDGHIILITRDGVVFALDKDLKTYSYVRLPRAAAAGESGKFADDFFGSFVRNGAAVDEDGGIYVVTNDFMHRVQWTGSTLSLDAADGAWAVPYANDRGLGSGTTPVLIGAGPQEDKLVIIADGSVPVNKATAFWRGKPPADWKGLPGLPRQVAGVEPITFGFGKNARVLIENHAVVYGYGAFFNNVAPVKPLPPQGSPIKQWLAETASMHMPGHEARGGTLIEWNPRQRKLKTRWRTQANLLSSVCAVSAADSTLYCWGSRDREWTLEAFDWKTGRNHHFTLGKSHRYNAMGGLVILDQAGSVNCGCGLGITRVTPRAP